MEKTGDDGVLGRGGLGVLDEVAERCLLVAADRHVQAHRVAAVVEEIGDLLGRDARLVGQFVVGGLATELLMELTLDPGELVHLLERWTGGSRIVRLWSAMPRVMA